MSSATTSALPYSSESISDVQDYIALLKPRVMSLVVFSGGAGLVVAPATLHPFLACLAIACIAIGCGGAAALNMWYERDIDALMRRTANRPIVKGRIAQDEALAFGCALSVASVAIMGVAINWVAAGLLAAAILFYVFIYTMWLKPRTPQNIVIGGAAGAFPPMIGWAAASGDISLASASLFLLIFLWTPPHFWALALYRSDDYRRAGIPMLPVIKGAHATKRQILAYTILLLPASILPVYFGIAGMLYGVSATILSGIFIAAGVSLFRDENHKFARLTFAYSIFYLFALFTLLMIDGGIYG